MAVEVDTAEDMEVDTAVAVAVDITAVLIITEARLITAAVITAPAMDTDMDTADFTAAHCMATARAFTGRPVTIRVTPDTIPWPIPQCPI